MQLKFGSVPAVGKPSSLRRNPAALGCWGLHQPPGLLYCGRPGCVLGAAWTGSSVCFPSRPERQCAGRAVSSPEEKSRAGRRCIHEINYVQLMSHAIAGGFPSKPQSGFLDCSCCIAWCWLSEADVALGPPPPFLSGNSQLSLPSPVSSLPFSGAGWSNPGQCKHCCFLFSCLSSSSHRAFPVSTQGHEFLSLEVSRTFLETLIPRN